MEELKRFKMFADHLRRERERGEHEMDCVYDYGERTIFSLN